MTTNFNQLICNTNKYHTLQKNTNYIQYIVGRFVKNKKYVLNETGDIVGIKIPGQSLRYYKLSNFITQ